ncbi:MAG: WG repeat-containing protein, partial [Bacteroidaceae bacterium]|nr:WG repeat-containing protein [Bacteroidaceae bacterium]
MKSIPSALLGMLMLMVCTSGNQVTGSLGILQDKDSMVIIAVNTYNLDSVLAVKTHLGSSIAKNTHNDFGYFVDSKGNKLFNKRFEWVGKFSEGLARVQQNGKRGFINTKGEVVVPCIFDYAEEFSEGLAFVVQKGKWGYINTKGEQVIPCIFDYAEEFSEGLA